MNLRGKHQLTASGKAWKWLVLVLVVLIVLAGVAVYFIPAYVSSDSGEQYILKKINKSTGGTADFGNLEMAWGRGIQVQNLSYTSKHGELDLKVKSLSTQPYYTSLLGGKIALGKTVVNEPRIDIDMRKAPPDEKRPKDRPPGEPGKPAELPVKRVDLVVNDGNFKVTDNQGRSTELADIQGDAAFRPAGQRSSVKAKMAVANDKPAPVNVEAEGEPDKHEGWSFRGTRGAIVAEVNDLDLESLGPLLALAGVEVDARGKVNGKIDGKIAEGQIENLTGKVTAKGLDVTAEPLQGDRLKTDTLDVDVQLATEKGRVNIGKLDMTADWAVLNASGTLPTSLKTLDDLVAPDSTAEINGSFRFDLAEMTDQMPRTLGIKEGMDITSGRLAGNVKTTGEAGSRRIEGAAGVTELKGIYDGKKIALTEPINLETQISATKIGTRFDKLDLSSSFAKFNMSGTADLLSYEGQADLAELQGQLGQFVDFGEYELAGGLTGEGQLSFTEKSISEVGLWRGRDISFRAKKGTAPAKFESEVVLGFESNYNRESQVLDVNYVDLNSKIGRVQTKNARIPLGEKAGSLKLAVDASKVDLAGAQPFLAQFVDLPEDWSMAGVADSDFAVTSIEDGYRFETDNTKIINLKVAQKDKKPFEQSTVNLKLQASVFPETRGWEVRGLELTSPQLTVRAPNLSNKKVAEKKMKLEGKVEADYDWAAVGTIVGPLMPANLELYGRRTSTINFLSQYPTETEGAMMKNLQADTKFGFDRANYMGLKFGAAETDLKINNGILNIAPFSTSLNQGTCNFAGNIDLNADPPLLETPKPLAIAKDVHVNTDMTEQMLKFVNPIFASLVSVEGVASFDCNELAIPLAKDTQKQIVVDGTLGVRDLTLTGSGFLGQIGQFTGGHPPSTVLTVRPTAFRLEDAIMRYKDDMQVDFGDRPLNFTGAIGLDKKLHDYTVILPYTYSGNTVRVDQPDQGNRVSLPVKGTLDKPQLDPGKALDQKTLEKLLEGTLKDKLDEALKDIFK